MRWFLLSTVLALVGACGFAQPPPVAMQTPFLEADHRAYLEPGTSAIRGQGFLRQQGGGVVTCAGEMVMIVPATGFFWEMVHHIQQGHEPNLVTAVAPASTPALVRLFHQSQCDAQGNFAFDALAPGKWVVLTQVKWKVGYGMQGGNLLRQILLPAGTTLQVLLSDGDFGGR